MISTRDLLFLPSIKRLRSISQSLALLDAILQPEWEYRYYSFDAHWNRGEAMASMRDGSGNSYFLLFSEKGAILKGFDHESPMSPFALNPARVWPGILEQVPVDFAAFFAEPAFDTASTTFCIWRAYSDEKWQIGDINFPDGADPDGSAHLLALLDDEPKSYQSWASSYYETEVDLKSVEHIFVHRPLTAEIVTSLNPNLDLQELAADLQEIAYGI